MKGPLVYIILLLSFGAILFVYKFKDEHRPDNVDLVERSLSGLKQKLPPDARIRYEGLLTDPVNGWEVQLMVRYTLIPANTSNDLDSDTSIYVVRRNDTSVFPPAGTTIWQNEDSVYSYKLIVKNKR